MQWLDGIYVGQEKNPGSATWCDLLFLYGEMIAMIHFVFCPSRSSHEEMSGLPQIKGKMVRSLCTRLKGKEGRLLLCRWTGRWAKEIYGVMDSHSPHYWVVDLSAGEVFFASPGKLSFFRLYPTRIVQHYAASSKRPSKHQKTIGESTQMILKTQSSTKKKTYIPPKKILKWLPVPLPFPFQKISPVPRFPW